jgi:hypothetical protein
MRPTQSRTTPLSAVLAAIAIAVLPARALAAESATHGREHERAAALRSTRSGKPGNSGSSSSLTTRTSGSDDGGSDDSVTTRTSRLKPVGGVGPLLGGGSSGSGARTNANQRRHHRQPRTRTSGAAVGGDN